MYRSVELGVAMPGNVWHSVWVDVPAEVDDIKVWLNSCKEVWQPKGCYHWWLQYVGEAEDA